MNDDTSKTPLQEPNSTSLEDNNPVMLHEVINPFVQPISNPQKTKNLALWTTVAAIFVLIFIALVGYVLVKSQDDSASNIPGTTSLDRDFSVVGLDQLNLGELGQLDVNGLFRAN